MWRIHKFPHPAAVGKLSLLTKQGKDLFDSVQLTRKYKKVLFLFYHSFCKLTHSHIKDSLTSVNENRRNSPNLVNERQWSIEGCDMLTKVNASRKIFDRVWWLHLADQ